MHCFNDMQRFSLQDGVARGTVLGSYAKSAQWQLVLHAASSRPKLPDNIQDVAAGCAMAEACQVGRRWLTSPSVLDVLDCLVRQSVQRLRRKGRHLAVQRPEVAMPALSWSPERPPSGDLD